MRELRGSVEARDKFLAFLAGLQPTVEEEPEVLVRLKGGEWNADGIGDPRSHVATEIGVQVDRATLKIVKTAENEAYYPIRLTLRTCRSMFEKSFEKMSLHQVFLCSLDLSGVFLRAIRTRQSMLGMHHPAST